MLEERLSLKRTAFFRTKRRLDSLESNTPLCLYKIAQLYQSEQTKGALNYARAILKKKQIIYTSLKKSILAIINQTHYSADIEAYRKLYECKVLEQPEIVGILKEAVAASPERTFEAVTAQDSALLQIFSLIQLDVSDAISIVAKGMLEQNKDRILEYINELTYSFTLKCLIKDGAGMLYLAQSVTESLTGSASTPGEIRDMVSQVISVCISLVKIDFTLVLLNSVIAHLKPALTKIIMQCGSDVGAESLFSGISSRIDELVEDPQTRPGASFAPAGIHPNTPFICRESILAFLFSLIPYDSMVETLALTISRDLALKKGSRKKFLQIFEGKVGACRISNINIIREDFACFETTGLLQHRVLEDATSAFANSPHISISPTATAHPFIYSHHYWPENNFSLPEDLFSFSNCNPTCMSEDLPLQQSLSEQMPEIQDKILLEYAKEHTYADITIEENGKTLDITVPIAYLEHIPAGSLESSSFGDASQAAKDFWHTVKLKLA
ncbi:hypothetical protein NECID01_0166 [Nematocida sp. AWRm77]|nr:hypothetical protein NECID01_0166 [Nematocida sp. AWRm77]